jgi:hypothetical protein
MEPALRPARRAVAARTYRWVAAWLIAGGVLALLLLANSIRTYFVVWRIIAVQQVRQQLSRQVVALEQAFRRSESPPASATAGLAELLESESAKPSWIEIRAPGGGELARAGLPPGRRIFSADEESASFRNREPLFRIVGAEGRETVVEVFPLRVPGLVPPPSTPPAAPGPGVRTPPRRSPAAVEVAAPLQISDPSVVFNIRRDLAINCSGALALLLTVVVSGRGFRSYARGRRLEAQLEIARQIQSELLPPGTEAFGNVRMAAFYGPAEQVSGDFYDAFQTDDGRLTFVIGDVSGKGLPAALVTGVVHGAVRASGWPSSAAAHERESVRLNELLCEKASVSRHVSLFWCSYEAASRRLRYVNAGHNPPLLARGATGAAETVRLEEGGPVLGLVPEARYVPAECEVRAGEVLVLYSDGLVEATSRTGEEYGEERLREALSAAYAGGPDATRDAIMASVRAFVGDQPYRDDVTLLVAKFG